jgi:hypothetical protein
VCLVGLFFFFWGMLNIRFSPVQLVLQETFNGPPPFAATAQRRPIFYRPLPGRSEEERTSLLDDDANDTELESEPLSSGAISPGRRGSSFLRLSWEMANCPPTPYPSMWDAD